MQVFGWIRFGLVVKERLWCKSLRNAREHLRFVYKWWRSVKETTEESKSLGYNYIQFVCRSIFPKGIVKKCIAVLFIVLAPASMWPCGKWDLGGDSG